MDKIILLDWDGPISNSRTWKMPGQVDPVAIQLVNDLTVAGWQTVLTATIRKNFNREPSGTERTDEVACIAATTFMRDRGFNVRWFGESWRTSVGYTNLRHLEVATWMAHTELPDDAIFLVVDDEQFPEEFLARCNMAQIHADSHSGIDYLTISHAYSIMRKTDAELAQLFAPTEGVL